jgi:TolB-like protein/DNA-binding winged helix-turn-helix (wHTH) protein/tetratricopeptide (TPR) repeat protein
MPSGDKEDTLQIGEWVVNPSRDSISRGTETQKLEPRTMRLLLCLADSAGEVVSVDRLLNEVWTGVVVGSASVYQAVSQLRKLLGDIDPNPTYIVNVPRKGYRLIAPVRKVAASSEIAAVAKTPVAETLVAAPPFASSLPPANKLKMQVIAAGVVLVALLAAGALVWKKSTGGRLVGAATSIVVLPFTDMTAEKASQSFCDGLTEELSNWLAQIPTLHVVARTSAFAFRGQGEDVRKIGKALDTNHILEGSMRRSGDHMRVTVQLVDARSGYHLWSEDFDQPIADAIKMQEDISRSVANTLQVRLTSDSERQFLARRSSDPEAYQLYLLGRHYSQQMTAESEERAIELYSQVVNKDPKFAFGYTQLAYARLNQGVFKGLPIADVAARVEPLIAAALLLDSRMSAAYAVRGTLRAAQDRTKEGLADLQLAISLNPSDMPAFTEIGHIQFLDGQPRDALASYDQAAALDPLNFAIQLQRCYVLDDLARYEEAVNACEHARLLKPAASSVDAFTWLAESRGRIDEALRWNEAAIKAGPNDDFSLYWSRSELFLSVGLPAAARAAVEHGRRATKNDDDANVALVRVVYREGGAQASQRYVESQHLEQSQHASALFEAAYARLLSGDAAAAKELIARAVVAPDRPTGFAESPFYAKGSRLMGTSYRLDLAVADLALGDRLAAQRELESVLAMLNRMMAAGVERYGAYELRAKIYALQGKGDDAMRDLSKAAKLGWRNSWWATHEPYLASLSPRSDFQALISEINRSNDQLSNNIKPDT